MSNLKLSQLPSQSSGAATDYVIANIGGVDVKIPIDKLFNAISSLTRSYIHYQLTSGPTVPSGTSPTSLIYNNKVEDILNEYNTGTGLFTATYGGIYNVSAAFQWTTTSSGNNDIMIYKNGALFLYNDFPGLSAGFLMTIAKNIHLSAGDTLAIYAQQDSGTGKVVNNDAFQATLTVSRVQY